MDDAISCDDYGKIRRLLGLSPKQWHRLQNMCHNDILDHLFCHHQAEIFGCQCQSVWCEQCSGRSPTTMRVSQIMSKLEWTKVRHIILTLDRSLDPLSAFSKIRANRDIPKFLRKLDAFRWIWILEFHSDGYPHWHVLAESPDGLMFGHRRITDAWRHGIVWESYIKNANHWGRIIGYHKKKGYLAGESKKHQLCLPEYLKDQTSVRKFAYSASLRDEKQSEPEVKEAVNKKKVKPRKPRTYEEKLSSCDEKVKVCINGVSWFELPGPLREIRELFRDSFDEIDYRTFNIDAEQLGTLFGILDLGKSVGLLDKDRIVPVVSQERLDVFDDTSDEVLSPGDEIGKGFEKE